jgi:hypothetical protein
MEQLGHSIRYYVPHEVFEIVKEYIEHNDKIKKEIDLIDVSLYSVGDNLGGRILLLKRNLGQIITSCLETNIHKAIDEIVRGEKK